MAKVNTLCARAHVYTHTHTQGVGVINRLPTNRPKKKVCVWGGNTNNKRKQNPLHKTKVSKTN